MDIAKQRLLKERKDWRKNHPFQFVARPLLINDTPNLFKWECFIPGKTATDWEGGHFKLMLEFSTDYPSVPPKCQFEKNFYHPNVYPSGTVCHSILDVDADWSASVSVQKILESIQAMLDEPNAASPANQEAFDDFVRDREIYRSKVKKQTERYPLNFI